MRSRRSLAVDLSSFVNNRSLRFSLRYSIVMVLEALADLAVAILEKDLGVAVESCRDAFLRLAEKGVINAEIAQSMVRLAGLRNITVHRYWSVDDIPINIYYSLKDFKSVEVDYIPVRGIPDLTLQLKRILSANVIITSGVNPWISALIAVMGRVLRRKVIVDFHGFA